MRNQKEARMRKNEQNCRAIREFPKYLWITKILIYLDVDDALRLGQVSIFFNQLTRSQLFVRIMTNRKTVAVQVQKDFFGQKPVIKK